MRATLVLLVGFWTLIGVSGVIEAYFLALGCAMVLLADCCARHCFKKIRRQTARHNRWCPPTAAPRRPRQKPGMPGRVVEQKPMRTVTVPIARPGRDPIVPVSRPPISTPRPANPTKHPGQDSNLQPAD